ncbi:MAG: Glu-tRNA(Gln) amidotransferase subunit GatD [Candidatus Altiarchaeota archaeon]|nr:Glu-tRNA(Gln) amidotransferase subunit GatD [Candidatus Altiarchaeota archaeon]
MKEVKPLHQVEIETEEKKYRGVLLKRPELADGKHIVLKLDNGYNIGLEKNKIKSIKDLGAVEVEEHKTAEQKKETDKPRVSIIATGGTIASRVDYLTGGVHSAFSAGELISAVPELSSIANISGRQLFNKFSENIQPGDWITMAESVVEEIKDDASGVVLTHGTDTMGYTAAALAFMLRVPVPVVLTGAQRSSDRGSSDAAMNLTHSVKVAGEADYSGVWVVMHASMSDDYCLIHNATRVRKMHSSRRDAFQSINSSHLGRVSVDDIEFFSEVEPRGGRLEPDTKMDDRVTLLKYHPGLNPGIVDSLVDSGHSGIVLEGTGLGHTSQDLFDSIKSAIDSGLVVCMSSQTLYGRVNMNVYSTGRVLLDYGVVSCQDMLPETALVKLMWVLGHTRNKKKAGEMMLTNYAGELSDRSGIDDDLSVPES